MERPPISRRHTHPALIAADVVWKLHEAANVARMAITHIRNLREHDRPDALAVNLRTLRRMRSGHSATVAGAMRPTRNG